MIPLCLQTGLLKRALRLDSRIALVTDETVAQLYGSSFHKTLLEGGLEAYLFAFPPGEAYKTRETKAFLEDQMLEKNLGRDTSVITLGGGIVTDMGGFLASTYCRGIPLIHFPTTLLAMVDASLGGKTSVNTPQGKNLIGSFYPPQQIFIDPLTLKSLPVRELKNGVVEMIKHGLIASPSHFEFLTSHAASILACDLPLLERAIHESCQIKMEIVEQDPLEKGKRHLLNLGHTVGHALEALSHYTLPHGEAVALGLLVESYLSLSLGFLDSLSFDKIQTALHAYALPLTPPAYLTVESILAKMTLDKKSRQGRPRFVLLEKIGTPLACEGRYCDFVEEASLKHTLEWMFHL